MKTFLLTVLFLFSMYGSDFNVGYIEGYKAGFCYQEYSCTPPIAPIPPIPNVGESTYQDGYNRGFIDGIKAKR
jgi:hypothetical protein